MKRVPMREMDLVVISKRTGLEIKRRRVFVRVTPKNLIWDRAGGGREFFSHEGNPKKSNWASMERFRLEEVAK